ncbi:Argininosuccinate lyase [bioreactor metagenome]|uniref:Argininosuccinate lyase n=1 Tax=bioreactor metagenome TaxID=1076179 RepID=A0A645I5J5_9ZZZZ
MPQKKNPDVAELVRGKTGRVFGHLMAMLTVAKGLPLAYNKDLQEDKEGLFDTIDTVKFSLTVYASMIRAMRVNPARMLSVVRNDFSNATDMADYLVKKGLPFRQAHEVVGKSVRYCIEQEKWLMDLSLAEFKQFSELFEADILEAIKVETCVANRNSFGGTSYAQVGQAVETAQATMTKQQAVLDMYTKAKI